LYSTVQLGQQLKNTNSHNMLGVDVNGNTLTTMSTQLQPDCMRDDDEL